MPAISRAAILEEAQSWIGTPYRHQASAKGAGCDCLGLIRGVWRGVVGAEPEETPPYTPSWDEDGEEILLAAAGRLLQPVTQASPGDVMLFRMRTKGPAKHAAILGRSDRLIHAYWGRSVLESRFAPWWRARLAAAFAFPGASPWPS